jgi:hypothetical protein
VVTGGDRGCWYAEGAGAVHHVPAFEVAVVDTTGCGDVFHGAYAACIARGEPVRQAIRVAAAAAALKATRPGGRAGIPTRPAVDAFLAARPVIEAQAAVAPRPAPERPIRESYWVQPGRLLAGEYPGAPDEIPARLRLRLFLAAGVTFFLDLTEEGESGLVPYAPALQQEAAALGRNVTHRRLSVRDMSAPTEEQMRAILDTVDAALAAGETVYLHCWGGTGRTGTAVGCHLVRHGMSGDQALQQIKDWLYGTAKRGRPSPETEEQRRLVLSWKQGM